MELLLSHNYVYMLNIYSFVFYILYDLYIYIYIYIYIYVLCLNIDIYCTYRYILKKDAFLYLICISWLIMINLNPNRWERIFLLEKVYTIYSLSNTYHI